MVLPAGCFCDPWEFGGRFSLNASVAFATIRVPHRCGTRVARSAPTGPAGHHEIVVTSQFVVGMGRFELPTPCSQSRCAARLRHIPLSWFSHLGKRPARRLTREFPEQRPLPRYTDDSQEAVSFRSASKQRIARKRWLSRSAGSSSNGRSAAARSPDLASPVTVSRRGRRPACTARATRDG